MTIGAGCQKHDNESIGRTYRFTPSIDAGARIALASEKLRELDSAALIALGLATGSRPL
jgi:hypothetical protein